MEAMKPTYQIIYEGRNITGDISEYFESLTYTDHTKGKSDEVDLRLANNDGLWASDWMPIVGDKLSVSIGYKDGMVDCGTFTVDEVEVSGPPNMVNIRALSASPNQAIRTKKSAAYESQTLRQIATSVAKANDLQLVDGTLSTTTIDLRAEVNDLRESASAIRGAVANPPANIQEFLNSILAFGKMQRAAQSLVDKGRTSDGRTILQGLSIARNTTYRVTSSAFRAAVAFLLQVCSDAERIADSIGGGVYSRTSSLLDSIRIDRATQNRETDLEFLMRVGKKYGFYFSVKNDQLVFVYYADLEKSPSAASLSIKDLKQYSIKKKSDTTYKAASVKHHDPTADQTIEFNVEAGSDEGSLEFPQEYAQDTLEVRGKVENQQQAEMVAKAELHNHNSKQQEGSITVIGNPNLVAGSNVEVSEIGRLSGVYNIADSRHSITKSGGYVTTCNIKKIK